MKHSRIIRYTLMILAGLLPTAMTAQVSLLELDQRTRIFNRLQEGAGLSGVGATPGQFSAFFSFSSVSPKTGDDPESAPSGPGVGSFQLSYVRVGATLFGRASSLQFGEIIPRPDTDENGDDLAGNASDYWEPRPFEEIDRLGYRWSVNTGTVVATVAGNYDITWRKNDPENEKPADFDANPENYLLESGLYYVLYTHSHTADAGITINPPDVAEDGTTPVSDGYWLDQPPIFRDTERYHFSEGAGVVFATQPGPVTIIWKRKQNTIPEEGEEDQFFEIGGLFFRLYPQTYIVSGSPVKTPRTIYWTYQGFPGIPVDIPDARVSDIRIVYNSDMPEEVPVSEGFPLLPGSGIGSEGTGVSSSITSTLWYSPSEKALRALNRQGRLFVEFLGAPDPATNIPAHLGFEIVDVIEQPIPGDQQVDIGERIPERFTDEGEILEGRVANQPGGEEFVFRHVRQVGGQDVGGPDGIRFFARKQTRNLNDLVMWWLQEGIEGILWPRSYIRYDFDWPVDISRYSQYIRPRVANEEEAKETAVVLNGEEAPVVEYQDPLDQPRAFITGDFRFYTYLTPEFPSHRSLLRFLAGNEIRFERVFSWLDEALKERDVITFPVPGMLQPTLLYEAVNGVDGFSNIDGPRACLVSGEVLYVSNLFPGAIHIIDISDPAAPQQLSVIRHGDPHNMAGTWALSNAYQMAIDGDTLYVASQTSSNVTIVDVSDPASPLFVAEISDQSTGTDFTNISQARTVAVHGNYLFIGAQNTITVADISDPSSPSYVTEITESPATPGLDQVWQVGAVDGFLYVTAFLGSSFAIYSIGGDGSLTFQGIAEHGSGDFANLAIPRHFVVDGDVAYVPALFSGDVTIIDISNPLSPELITVIVGGLDGVPVMDTPSKVVLFNDLLVVSTLNGDDSLLFFDVGVPSDPRFITEVKKADLGAVGFDFIDVFAVDDRNYLYVPGQGSNTISVLDTNAMFGDRLVAGDLGSSGNSVATDLASYDPVRDLFFWPDESAVPRVVEETVDVGNRIAAPDGELGLREGETFWAGYLNIEIGDSHNPNAYIDPFLFGFTEANFGAIIPVNAIPGDNQLEVLWFRPNDEDTTDSFATHYWPAVLGRYTIEWPIDPAEIILASNDGTGPLPSLLATGSIYFENDPTQIGYNPNEEHALMQGGQGFALRDDLNITTNIGGEYSSDPFVLIEYIDSDGRISMEPFAVLREKPFEGITFTYDIEAATVIQAPMPLPLLELPLREAAESDAFNVNTEVSFSQIAASDVDSDGIFWSLDTIERPQLTQFSEYNLQSQDLSTNQTLFVIEASYDDNTLSGVIKEGELGLSSSSASDGEVSGYNYGEEDDQDSIAYFEVSSGDETVSQGDAVTLFSDSHDTFVALTVASVSDEDSKTVIGIDIPASMRSEFTHDYTVTIQVSTIFVLEDRTSQRYTFDSFLLNDLILLLPRTDLVDGDLDGSYISRESLTTIDVTLDYESKYTFEDRKGNLWVYRGPHTEGGPADSYAFDMKFYYKTLEGFYFPGQAAQPPIGTLAPYLRSLNGDGSYSGDPFGADDQANVVTYRPFWPDSPILFTGESLTLPKRGLPAVRGQSSAEIFYEQSENQGTPSDSAVFHDPTREKETFLSSDGLPKIPGSAATQSFLGKTFFTGLPPHLVERFFFDPNRGSDGALVFKGEFVDEVSGDDYLLLNVLSTNDEGKLKALVIVDDEDKAAWDAAIVGLETTVEIFEEDISAPGTFFPNVGRSTIIGFDELAEVTDDDAAVDSYALSATGPGEGYVTFLFGNGEAFTPVGDPVSMSVIRISSSLFTGEVKPILSDNPLSEMVTMQQVTDLAAKTDQFAFEWLIASPVDGSPPVVTLNQRQLLMGENSWTHLRFPTRFSSGASILDVDAARFGITAVGSLTAVEAIPFTAVADNGGEWEFTHDLSQDADLGGFTCPATPGDDHEHGRCAGARVSRRAG